MEKKRTIIYFEEDDGFLPVNSNRDALSSFLAELGFDVKLFTNAYLTEQFFPQAKKLVSRRLLACFIVKQARYCPEYTAELVENFKRNVSGEVTVIVLPYWGGESIEDRVKSGGALFMDWYDDGFFPVIASLEKTVECFNWLGAESLEEEGLLFGQLEKAYKANRFNPKSEEDDGMLGVPDHNHSVVAEALRIKIQPVEFLKEEFDEKIRDGPFDFCAFSRDDYIIESELIKAMSNGEKAELSEKMRRTMGRVGHGEKISAYAIDPITLESFHTNDFGSHSNVPMYLESRVDTIEIMRSKMANRDWEDNYDSEKRTRHRFFTGLIYHAVPGFKIPILRLDWWDGRKKSQLKSIVEKIRSERKFIVVDKALNVHE